MRWRSANRGWLKPALGGLLTAFVGVLLWGTPFGEGWVLSSYDYLFRFGHTSVTNRVVLVAMDNEAYDEFDQVRELQNWDRGLHAQLLNRLAADGSKLVVLDSFLRRPGDGAKDAALLAAMRKQAGVVLMARQEEVDSGPLLGARPLLPAEIFVEAARGKWGVTGLHPDLDAIVRRHWPFPAPGPYPSLPWVVATEVGARLGDTPREQWLRFYGPKGAWQKLSYRFALGAPTNFFSNAIVFIGRLPKSLTPESEDDKFQVPYSRWTGDSVGGVEVMMTMFLNLVNHDWLERPPVIIEVLLLLLVGAALGAGLVQLRIRAAIPAALLAAVIAAMAGITLSFVTNFWFPWLVVAAGQVPCALAWAMIVPLVAAPKVAKDSSDTRPEVGDYELVDPPFGRGSYGKVWLAKNAVGQWQALKVVYRASFGSEAPYDREFGGITKYKPISDKHSGLLRVDFVSKKRPDYFYYVMELGDGVESGWEKEPTKYRPLDLAGLCKNTPGRRLSVRQCVRIALEVIEGLDFLHGQNLTHRDIKPQNVIFVNGHAKLADVGLVAELRSVDEEGTLVGTPGYMPPPPESPGTAQADIFALGMVLYMMATGKNASSFPEIGTSLTEAADSAAFFALNGVILKACKPNLSQRYQTAEEMRQALLQIQQSLELEGPDF